MMLKLQRFWIQMTADKRKFGGLCIAVILLLLLWARLILVSNSPRTAVAERASEQREASEAPGDPPSDKRETIVRTVSLPSNPGRDPFIISDEHFPKPAVVDDLPADRDKSPPKPAEDPEEVEARFRAELRSLVDLLTLDASMSSANLAVISGQTYGKGERVPAPNGVKIGFTLTEVERRSVTLEFEGRRFKLKMSDPGG